MILDLNFWNIYAFVITLISCSDTSELQGGILKHLFELNASITANAFMQPNRYKTSHCAVLTDRECQLVLSRHSRLVDFPVDTPSQV